MKQRLLYAFLPLVLLCAVGLSWAVPAARADWRSLTGPLPAHVNGLRFQISPDSKTVAFVADKDTDDVEELYAVPLAGGTPVKLNPPLVAGGDVNALRFAFTPDSQQVVYLADQEVDNRVDMFRVPVAGGAAVKINPSLVAGGNVDFFKIDSKSQRIVYQADQQSNDVTDLWSIPLAGGASLRLNGSLVAGGDVGLFDLDPLSNRVVYSADQETDGTYELYSVPVAGGAVAKLNPPITLGGGGDAGIFSDWFINPIVPVVVFQARESGATTKNLWMTPTAGGVAPLKLNFALSANQHMVNFRISPTGDRVIYSVGTRSGTFFPSKGDLYSVLIGGGSSTLLTEVADPLHGADNFSFTADGKRVVYSFQKNAAALVRLESATVVNPVRVTLFAPAASDSPLSYFRLSRDSQWVVVQDQANGLFSVPPGGGNLVRHGQAYHKQIMSDSSRLLYARITDADKHTELMSAQIFGGDERDLSGMQSKGYVLDAELSPDGTQIVYGVQLDGRYGARSIACLRLSLHPVAQAAIKAASLSWARHMLMLSSQLACSVAVSLMLARSRRAAAALLRVTPRAGSPMWPSSGARLSNTSALLVMYSRSCQSARQCW